MKKLFYYVLFYKTLLYKNIEAEMKGKAAGIDSITFELLRAEVATSLLKYFTSCLRKFGRQRKYQKIGLKV